MMVIKRYSMPFRQYIEYIFVTFPLYIRVANNKNEEVRSQGVEYLSAYE